MLVEIVACFLFALIGCVIADTIRLLLLMRNIRKQRQKDSSEEITIVAVIERYYIENHNGIYYMWSFFNDDFVTQGKTIEELSENVLKYHQVKTAFVTYDEKLFMFMNGTVKALNEG